MIGRIGRIVTLGTVATAAALLALAPSAAAAPAGVATVAWAADGSVNGAGTGTLGVGSVTYATATGGNAGIFFGYNWNTAPETNAAVGSGASNLNGGALGVNGNETSHPQTISFTHSITDPMIFVSWTDNGTSYDFGTNPVTLLDSNNTSLSGNVVNCAGSGNHSQDGFAVRVSGTFGPGNPLSFNLNNTSGTFQSVIFTVAASQPTMGNTAATTPQNTAITVKPLTADTPAAGTSLDPSSVRLLDAGGNPVSTLTTGDGTYVVDTSTGEVAFSPAAGFTGTAAAAPYRVVDSNGIIGTASITITVTPVVDTPMISSSALSLLAGPALLIGLALLMIRRRRGVSRVAE